MSEKPRTWGAIFDLWRDPQNPTDGGMCRRLATDIGVNVETARQWYRSGVGAVPPQYWRKLLNAIERRESTLPGARIRMTYEDLALATEQLRPPKLREEAA